MSENNTQQPIVTTPAHTGVNPFARRQSEHLAAGAVEIESQRAVAEVQSKLVIAKRFPRDPVRAYEAAMQACRRPTFAKDALYAFPRAGETVSGPSIRLAEMLAACWGNIEYGIRELSRKPGRNGEPGESEMEAFAWDQETNVTSSQRFAVRHLRDTRGGGKTLTDERDIYELTANQASRRLRARILAVIPQDLADAAEAECRRTLEGKTEEPMADRVRKMLAAFGRFGVTAALIERRLGHSLDNVLPEEFADLTMIRNSLRDHMSKVSDWFDVREEAAEQTTSTLNAVISAQAAPVQAPTQAAPAAQAAPTQAAPTTTKEIGSDPKQPTAAAQPARRAESRAPAGAPDGQGAGTPAATAAKPAAPAAGGSKAGASDDDF